jgi:hypothetical protein
MKHVMPLAEARAGKKAIQNDHILAGKKQASSKQGVPWPTDERHFGWSKSGARRRAANEHPGRHVARWKAAAPAARPYRPDHRR